MDRCALFVSPHSDDAEMIARMLRPVFIALEHVASLEEARVRLPRKSYGAVLTEAFLPDGDWKDLLTFTRDTGITSSIIVTHRIADDRFWAEVLNLGCYDMLAQPFDTREVQRIIALACAQGFSEPVMCPQTAGKATKSWSAAY